MRYCMNCGRPNDDNAAFCTSCGNRLQQQNNIPNQFATQYPQKQNKSLFLVPGVVSIFCLFGSIVMFTNTEESTNDRLFGGFFFLALALIAAVVFTFLLHHYHEKEKDYKEKIKYMQLEMEYRLRQQEMLKQQEEERRITARKENKLDKLAAEIKLLQPKNKTLKKHLLCYVQKNCMRLQKSI